MVTVSHQQFYHRLQSPTARRLHICTAQWLTITVHMPFIPHPQHTPTKHHTSGALPYVTQLVPGRRGRHEERGGGEINLGELGMKKQLVVARQTGLTCIEGLFFSVENGAFKVVTIATFKPCTSSSFYTESFSLPKETLRRLCTAARSSAQNAAP